MKPVLLTQAYVLHRRSYRENSFLVDIFSKEHGRVSLVARSARQSGKQGLLQPFTPLLISWVGRTELMTLTDVELYGKTHHLKQTALYAGFYLNELLTTLLHKWDTHPMLFEAYKETLLQLSEQSFAEKILRRFEKKLLENIGYGVLSKEDLVFQSKLIKEKYYRFLPEQGFVVTDFNESGSQFDMKHPFVFSGEKLLAIAQEDWDKEGVALEAKRLMRIILNHLLENKVLNSRKLFL